MAAHVFPQLQQRQAAAAQPVLPRQASSPLRRGRASRRDPLEPKQNKTPFNFFSIDARAKAKAANPGADQKVHQQCSNGCGLWFGHLCPIPLCLLHATGYVKWLPFHAGVLKVRKQCWSAVVKTWAATCRKSARLWGKCGSAHPRMRRPLTSSRYTCLTCCDRQSYIAWPMSTFKESI